MLRRALELEPLTHRVVGPPAPLGKGSRLPAAEDGGGPGFRASRYILEVAKARFQQSGLTAFSARTVNLACRGWPETTVHGGLRRLVKDGYIARTGRGQYELTESGQDAPPAPAHVLPLMAAEAAR